jgi:hypothetical protein
MSQLRARAAMFFAYALLLVGRGLPFWLGTALFVARSCSCSVRADRHERRRRIDARRPDLAHRVRRRDRGS